MASRGPPARARHCHPDRGAAGPARAAGGSQTRRTGAWTVLVQGPRTAGSAACAYPDSWGRGALPRTAGGAACAHPDSRGRERPGAQRRCGRDSLAMRNVCGNSYQTRGRSVGVQLPTPNQAFLSGLLASRRTHDLQGSSFPSSVPHSLCGWSPPTTASPCATQAVAAEGTGYFRQGDYIQEGQRCTSRIQQSG